jgi:hypothetical protein
VRRVGRQLCREPRGDQRWRHTTIIGKAYSHVSPASKLINGVTIHLDVGDGRLRIEVEERAQAVRNNEPIGVEAAKEQLGRRAETAIDDLFWFAGAEGRPVRQPQDRERFFLDFLPA